MKIQSVTVFCGSKSGNQLGFTTQAIELGHALGENGIQLVYGGGGKGIMGAIANAVLDGADALMLSGETSVGEFPVETVETMARIIESTEDNGLERIPNLGTRPHTHSGAVSLAAVEIAELLGSKYVCVFTESGDSLRRVSRLRSSVPILAFSPSESVRNRLALVWGARSYLVAPVKHTDEMMFQVDEILLGENLAKIGEEVVVVAGTPPGIPGSTNSLRVHRVGDAVNQMAPGYVRN